MVKLTDTFRTEDSRVSKAIVAVDLTNSTRMKQEQGEAGWLNTYGWFFDMAGETIGSYEGKIVKYLGDGLMAVFPDDRAAEAINWSIVIQEEMASARARNLVKCSCSIGIAFGELVEFDSAMGAKDYIGTVADRAFRLCSAANANAIFVDPDTVAAASMTRIASKAGRSVATRRTASEYQGSIESVQLKGFADPVGYFEILWENSRFSIKPELATELSSKQTRTVSLDKRTVERLVRPERQERPIWIRGRVSSLGPKFGFITGPENEQFWFNEYSCFSREHPAKYNDEVWFLPLDARSENDRRRAGSIVPFGTRLNGRLDKVFPDGYGFALITTDRSDAYSVFVNLGDSAGWSQGDPIVFTVGANAKGFAGFDASPFVGETA